MAAMRDGDVADEDIAAKLDRDGLVAEADGAVLDFRTIVLGRLFARHRKSVHFIQQFVAALEVAAVDPAVACDENIREIFAPDQTVVKIAMASVLIRIVRPRLGEIVGVHGLRCAEYGRARVNEEMNVALEMD